MEEKSEKELSSERRMARYRQSGIDDSLIFNLRDISHTMRFLYEGKGSQKRILIILGRTGTITQQELTKRLGIQPGSASEVIAKLEGAGLITREPSETDRRTVDIALTEKGRRLALEAEEQRSRRHEEMFSCLSEDEKAELLALLEKVNADWGRRYQDIAEGQRHCHKEHGGRCGAEHGKYCHEEQERRDSENYRERRG